jgi:hypothetical protein
MKSLSQKDIRTRTLISGGEEAPCVNCEDIAFALAWAKSWDEYVDIGKCSVCESECTTYWQPKNDKERVFAEPKEQLCKDCLLSRAFGLVSERQASSVPPPGSLRATKKQGTSKGSAGLPRKSEEGGVMKK